jgi:hypothetical protein
MGAPNFINGGYGRYPRFTAAMRWCTVTEVLRRVVIPLPSRQNYAKADARDDTTIEIRVAVRLIHSEVS